jgi:cysteinyl-tRNA synthetase
MSKSLNNTILIRDMLKTYTSTQFRLFCLMHDYRSGKLTRNLILTFIHRF